VRQVEFMNTRHDFTRNCDWRVLAVATCLSLVLSVPGNPQASKPVTRRLYQVSVGGRSGYIDSTGKTIILLCFDEAGQFSEGLAVVQIRGRYGYIDTTGTVVIEPQFEYADRFSEGLAIVGTREKRYYIDRTGRVAIGPKFDVSPSRFGSPGEFHDGRAPASIGGVEGYIDHTGSIVIRSQPWLWYPWFKNGLAAIEVEGQVGFIDTAGTVVIRPQFPAQTYHEAGGSGFSEGFAAVPIAGKWGFIDKTGRVVIPAQFVWAGSFNEGLAPARVGTKLGFINTAGTVVIAPQFTNTGWFSEGLAAVRVGDTWGHNWGYIDRTGRLVIAAQFDAENGDFMSGFWHGIAPARRGDEKGYIDRTGHFVWTERGARTAASRCPPELAQQPVPAPPAHENVETLALPTLSPVPQPSGRPQEDSARPILYYEELNDQPVLTGLYLDGRRVVVPADNAATIPLWSPDGAWVAYSTVDSATHAGVLAVVNLRGERHRLLVTRDSLPAFPRWSPDGRFIATLVVRRDESAEPKSIPLIVISVVDNAVRSRVSIPIAALTARVQPTVSWSPDGQRILVAGDIAVVATIATGVIDTISPHPVIAQWGSTADVVYYFATPDSGRSAHTQTPAGFFVRRLGDREPRLLASADRVAKLGAPYEFVPMARRLARSPDGKRLAFWGRPAGDSSDVVRVYDVAPDSVIDLDKPSATFRQAGVISGLQWGPQGRGLAALVSTDQGMEIRHLDVASGKWKKLATVRAGGAADYYGFGILSLSWTQ